MKKRFSEEQIVKMIQEQKERKSVAEISLEYGVAEQTFYKWQQKYGDMKVSEVKKMKSLEEENAKLILFQKLHQKLYLHIQCRGKMLQMY